VTVTFVLFQPAALGAGATAAIVTGGVVSEVNVGAGIRMGLPVDGGREGSLAKTKGVPPFAARVKPMK